MPVVAIPVAEDDFDQAWPALRQLGLTHAAVTSPLKSRALALADERSAEAKRTGAANTLVIHDGRLYAHNTDYLALKDWQRELGPQQKVWIWGRGALLPTLQELWPQAEAISAREGINKGSEQGPDLLIWATNRSRPFTWPTVRPGQILDLNYTDDSPGLELAVALQRPYHSGLKQFKLQADWQRRFWSKM